MDGVSSAVITVEDHALQFKNNWKNSDTAQDAFLCAFLLLSMHNIS